MNPSVVHMKKRDDLLERSEAREQGCQTASRIVARTGERVTDGRRPSPAGRGGRGADIVGICEIEPGDVYRGRLNRETSGTADRRSTKRPAFRPAWNRRRA
jgi:hypothetical protein